MLNNKVLVCPHCKAVHPFVHNLIGDRGPEPGDMNICADCSGLSFYDDEGDLQLPTENDMNSLSIIERMQILDAQITATHLRDKHE